MSQPKVNITELDGQLGVLPPSEGQLPVFIGVSSLGTVDTPSTYARVTDLVAAFGVGPGVEAAAFELSQPNARPVVFIRTGQTTAGDYGAIDDDGVTGTANGEITETAATEPLDDYDVVVLIMTGGTTGTTGITYKVSLDGGNTYGAETALGTGLTLAIAGTGVSFDITTAKTFVADDFFTCRTSAPNWNSTELASALTALAKSIVTWEVANIVGPLDATTFDTVDTAIAGLVSSGKYRSWIGHARNPNEGESEATYKSALDTIFSAKATVHGVLCAGATDLTSAVSGRKYRRPSSFVVGARECTVSHEVNTADINLGPLRGCSIRDANGNPNHHDESANPGLDDSRFCVLRTWEGEPGVFINRPRLFSSETSDFQLHPHRRVLNLAHAALRSYFQRRLNKPVRVNKATGFILEEEALEIEAGARSVMRSVLMAKPKASGIEFALSRTDNILSTKTLNGTARVIPLAYPETINLEVGFKNPALLVQAQAA